MPDLCAGCDRGELCDPARFGRVEFIAGEQLHRTGVCDRCVRLIEAVAASFLDGATERFVWFSGPLFAWDNSQPRRLPGVGGTPSGVV